MKAKRKLAPGRIAAQVISLEAYRNARSAPMPAAAPVPVVQERDSITTEYYRWLALAFAVWTFWW